MCRSGNIYIKEAEKLKLHPFIVGGVSATNLSFNGDTVKHTDISSAINDYKKHEIGYLVGVGSNFKKFSLEFRFEQGNGMSKYILLQSTTNSFYFLLGYKLN